MRTDKVWKVASIVIVSALLFVACQPAPIEEETEAPAPTKETEAEPAEEEPFKIAAVFVSPTNDYCWTERMYKSLITAQEEVGEDALVFDYSDSMFVVDDAAAAIRDYASQGYDLIIAHGSQYGSSLQEIAPDFPETGFAWGTTVDTFEDKGIHNIFAYTVRGEEPGYVFGIIGEALSQTKVLGVVASIDTGEIGQYVRGFKLGAETANPDVDVNITYMGSFTDVTLAAEGARTHIDNGADVLTGQSQLTSGAIGVAEEEGLIYIASQGNKAPLAPNTVAVSYEHHWEDMILDMVSLIKSGTYGGKVYELTLANGGIQIVYNPEFDMPEEVKALGDETVQKIVDGEITVDVSEE